MCGIAGRVGAGTSVDTGAAVAALTHRGPDSSGVRSFDDCALGMRRLRVVDLRPEADQPMRGEGEGVWLVYNGELFNHGELRRELEDAGHAFRSRSDTEVIVHGYEQWGDAVVHRLRGMFAFAVYDAPARRLLLARDRLGIKPLYLRHSPEGGLAFASESHALGPGELDPRAVASYLRLGWVGGTGSATTGVVELPPGHLLVHSDGRSRVERYWAPTWRDEAADVPALAAALRDSVQRHLVADVPVGIFLSSGLDSTVVASLAAEHGSDVRTYTVAFDDGPDEVGPARALAGDLGLPHEVVRLSGTAITSSMDQVVAAMDQPTVDGVNSWAISRAVREAGVTVALSGLGGDELFSGYSTFRHAPRIARVGARVPTPALALAGRALGAVPPLALGRVTRAAEAGAHGGLPAAYAGVRGLLPWQALPRLWPGGAALLRGLRDADLLDTTGPGTVAALEVRNYLRYQLLRDTDLMSMASSLEVRVPLLDDAVVAAALVTGPSAEGLSGKALLAHAAGPAAVASVQRPKQTFTLPFDRWMRTDMRDWVRGRLGALGAAPLGFSATELQRLDDAFLAGRLEWRPLWALAVLGAWVERRGLV